MTASIVEDCALPYLWRVKITQDRSIRVACDEEDIKTLLDLRHGPRTDAGRRRPVLHWVRSHGRRNRMGKLSNVRKHLRGLTAFEIDGFGIEIMSPEKER